MNEKGNYKILADKLSKAKKILIVGDGGRGKSSMAMSLSKILSIPHYSTDDFLWRHKYTQKETAEASLAKSIEVIRMDSWIIEGATRTLWEKGLDSADLIIYLGFKTIWHQWYALIKRSIKRKEERWADSLYLLRHVFYKRFQLGYQKHEPNILEYISVHNNKTIELYSYKDINTLLDTIKF